MKVVNQEVQDVKDLDDILSASMQKARGIAALINSSASTDEEVTSTEMSWASWALMDLLRDAHEASKQLSEIRFKELTTKHAV